MYLNKFTTISKIIIVPIDVDRGYFQLILIEVNFWQILIEIIFLLTSLMFFSWHRPNLFIGHVGWWCIFVNISQLFFLLMSIRCFGRRHWSWVYFCWHRLRFCWLNLVGDIFLLTSVKIFLDLRQLRLFFGWCQLGFFSRCQLGFFVDVDKGF